MRKKPSIGDSDGDGVGFGDGDPEALGGNGFGGGSVVGNPSDVLGVSATSLYECLTELLNA